MSAANLEKAQAAWGELPAWVRLLANECDHTSQREVGERLGISGSYVTRLINHSYQASYYEAEEIVLAIIGRENVECPAFGAIPLTSCIRARRRKGPAINTLQRTFERHCPNCQFNSDRHQQENGHDA